MAPTVPEIALVVGSTMLMVGAVTVLLFRWSDWDDPTS